MAKEEKKRTFESETFILPPLNMILSESDGQEAPSKKRKKLPESPVKEEIVMRIIDKLIKKE